jgi:HAT1-interacting factor 1
MATNATEAAPDVANSTNAANKLKELVIIAAAKEAAEDYTAATDLYSQATELQAEINGEMAVTNADLLYSYGKCLYRVAVSKSDVLGANIPAGVSGEPKSAAKGPPDSSKRAPETEKQRTSKQSDQPTASTDPAQSSSYFQFIGDDNFDNSEEEDFSDTEGGDAGADDDEDDFATAFETLDLARILFLRRLEEISAADSTSGSGVDGSTAVRRVKEHLSDIYDLQAEISLEGERFSDAVADLQAALELNEELYPVEDPVVAECHYKLSLALEFASIIKPEDGESESNAPTKFDMTKRKEAEKHMERAIESCRLRISKEEERLNTGAIDDAEKAAVLRRKVAEVKEIVTDMEQRVCSFNFPFCSSFPPQGNLQEFFLCQDGKCGCLWTA